MSCHRILLSPTAFNNAGLRDSDISKLDPIGVTAHLSLEAVGYGEGITATSGAAILSTRAVIAEARHISVYDSSMCGGYCASLHRHSKGIHLSPRRAENRAITTPCKDEHPARLASIAKFTSTSAVN